MSNEHSFMLTYINHILLDTNSSKCCKSFLYSDKYMYKFLLIIVFKFHLNFHSYEFYLKTNHINNSFHTQSIIIIHSYINLKNNSLIQSNF